MVRLKLLFGFTPFILSLLVFTCNGFAQEQANSIRVEGYKGTASILSNAERKETTIAFTLNLRPDDKSGQIVFHIQETTGNLPPAWSGQAVALVGDGLLAIIPADKTRALLFKFPETQLPASLGQMSFDEYAVFGIARFGEKTPLTHDQILELNQTGRIASIQVTPGTDGLTLTPRKNSLVSQIAALGPAPEDGCVAGGKGSTSCGAGGCTVTCGSGYYACCEAGTCLCQVNYPPQ
jgi:hypothetical protein